MHRYIVVLTAMALCAGLAAAPAAGQWTCNGYIVYQVDQVNTYYGVGSGYAYSAGQNGGDCSAFTDGRSAASVKVMFYASYTYGGTYPITNFNRRYVCSHPTGTATGTGVVTGRVQYSANVDIMRSTAVDGNPFDINDSSPGTYARSYGAMITGWSTALQGTGGGSASGTSHVFFTPDP